MVPLCRRIASNSRFDAFMLGVIVFNAVILGMETYDALEEDYGGLFHTINDVILGLFVVELAIRLTACWPKPGTFFKSGWNVFDFIVVVAAFLPGLRENAALLRIVRLARILRAVRFLPDLRVVFIAVGRSLPGVASLAALTLLLVYLYAMVGWVIFHQEDPANFGTAGQAMVTMFVLLTLENLPTYIEAGQEMVGDWTVAFYVSYVLVASFLVFNLFIGIVLNSMEEARNQDRDNQRAAEREAAAKTADLEDDLVVDLQDKIDAARAALDALQEELEAKKRDAARAQT